MRLLKRSRPERRDGRGPQGKEPGTGERWRHFPFLSPLPGLLVRQWPHPGLAPGAIYLTALRACPGRGKRSDRRGATAPAGAGGSGAQVSEPGTGGRWRHFPFLSPLPGLLVRQWPHPGLAPGAIYLTALRACPGRGKPSDRRDAVAPAGAGGSGAQVSEPGTGGRWRKFAFLSPLPGLLVRQWPHPRAGARGYLSDGPPGLPRQGEAVR